MASSLYSSAAKGVGSDIRAALRTGERRIRIAQRFGVSTQAVSYHAKALGLPSVAEGLRVGGKRRCSKCWTAKPLKAFYSDKTKLDGMSSWCRDCQNSANEAVLERKRDFVWKYLKEHPCVDCGEDDPIVLDFDHVRGAKIREISMMMGSYSWVTLKAEVAKCEVRCASCHRRKTAERSKSWRWRRRLLEAEVR